MVSDIHANLDGLNAVLKASSGQWSGFLCLGDITGYGTEPGACIDLLQELAETAEFCQILAGNHDAVLSGRIPESWFNEGVLPSIEYTKENLSSDRLDWLAGLPSLARISVPDDPDSVLAVHGSPAEPLSGYLWGGLETEPALSYLADEKISLCFAGHTHEVGVFSASWTDLVRFPAPGETVCFRDFPVIVNPGSTGFPRTYNGTKEVIMKSYPALYAIWDTCRHSVSFFEARYDRRAFEKRLARLK